MDKVDSIYDGAKRIKDPDIAHEIAELEKLGRDKASDREKELERRAKEGLTDEEAKNIALMKSLEEEYPLAFRKGISPDGKEVLEIVGWSNQIESPHLPYGVDWYLSQQGIFGMKKESVTKVEGEKLQNLQKNPGMFFRVLNRILDNTEVVPYDVKDTIYNGLYEYHEKSTGRNTGCFRLDLFGAGEKLRQEVGALLKAYQAFGEREQQRVQEAQKNSELSRVMADMTGK